MEKYDIKSDYTKLYHLYDKKRILSIHFWVWIRLKANITILLLQGWLTSFRKSRSERWFSLQPSTFFLEFHALLLNVKVN